MGLKRMWAPIGETFSDFSADRAPRLAAALAYYTIFALAPLLLIVIAVAGMIWGQEAVRGELVAQFEDTIGPQAAQQVQTMIANASEHAQGGAMLTVGIVVMIFGAMAVFVQLKDALNTVWDVKLKRHGGWRGVWQMVRTYVLSFAMIFVIAFLLLASLITSAALSAMSRWFANVLPMPEWAMHALNLGVSFAIITVLFASIYKILPDVNIRWSDVWAGAAITAALFVIGKFALGFYLGQSSAASVYGAAGSIVLILLWVYYASMIFLFGAEFTQVYARRWGRRMEPKPWAEPVPGSDLAKRIQESRTGDKGLPGAGGARETGGAGRDDHHGELRDEHVRDEHRRHDSHTRSYANDGEHHRRT